MPYIYSSSILLMYWIHADSRPLTVDIGAMNESVHQEHRAGDFPSSLLIRWPGPLQSLHKGGQHTNSAHSLLIHICAAIHKLTPTELYTCHRAVT